MFQFTAEILNKGQDYEDFIKLSDQIIEQKASYSPYDDPFYLSYTNANHRRRLKILKDIMLHKKLYNELAEGIRNWTWVVIDEPWCGDASFIVPVLKAMELAAGGDIEMKIFLRDENPEIMEQYLTNNGKSIPKLICLDENLNELGHWGPRPQNLSLLVKAWMAEAIDMNEKIKRVNRWYHKDNSESIQKEFIDLIKYWKNKQA